MLIFLSPAKSLDYQTPPHIATHTVPAYLKQSELLIKQLRKLSPADIANLMTLSDPLALLNFKRYAEWHLPFTPENAKQAALAFDGDVYDGLSAKTLSRRSPPPRPSHPRSPRRSWPACAARFRSGSRHRQ